MDFRDALKEIYAGKKMTLPEWIGYWFLGKDGKIEVLAKDGRVHDTPWFQNYCDRTDWKQWVERQNPSEAESEIKDGWEAGFYSQEFSDAAYTSQEDAADARRFIWSVCGGLHAAKIFDQCCGNGALMAEFAKVGCKVYGVDLCERNVRAAEALREECVRRHVVSSDTVFSAAVGNAFDYVAPEKCDVAVNWHTSFGGSLSRAVNAQMLARAAESLKPGGHLFMSLPNPSYVIRHFQKWKATEIGMEKTRTLVVRECRLDGRILSSRWTAVAADGSRKWGRGRTVMYFPDELEVMCAGHELKDVSFCGNTEGSELTGESKTMILHARKK